MQDSVQQRGRVQSAPHLRLLTWEGSDAELLELAALGDEAAAARFHDRFANGVHALVRALVGSDSSHTWLVKKSLLTAYRALFDTTVLSERSASVGQLPALVEMHTVRVIRAYLRNQCWLRRFGLGSTRFDPTTEDQVLVFYEHLAELAPDLRIAFCLRYVAGRALSDSARLCNCTVAEFRRRLSRAESFMESMTDTELESELPEVGWES